MFSFLMITWVNSNEFSPNLVCALILWIPGFWLLMDKFCQFLTESSACSSIFLFPDDNLSTCQWIFTKLDMCIDIVEIWFRIANGQILSVFDRVICLPYNSDKVLSFHVFHFFSVYSILSNTDSKDLNQTANRSIRVKFRLFRYFTR